MSKSLSVEERAARRCSNCGRPDILARNMCSLCYNWQRRYGTARPADTKSRRPVVPPRPCRHCGVPEKPLTRGYCRNCYERWRRTGTPERPPRRAIEPPVPPAPEDFFFEVLTRGYTGRWPGRAVTGPPGPRAAEVRGLLALLDAREHYVLQMMFGLDGQGRRAYNDVATALGLTRQRICQIQHESMAKLRKEYRRIQFPSLPGPPPPHAPLLEALAQEVRAEQALVAPRPDEDGAHTWEAGMVAGLRIGKRMAYDMVLSIIDEMRIQEVRHEGKEEST